MFEVKYHYIGGRYYWASLWNWHISQFLLQILLHGILTKVDF